MIFLAPYYIIKFKERLDEINDNKEQLDELVAEYQDIYVKISELAEQNEFDESYIVDVVCLTEKLIDVVAKGKENIRREVNTMGGNILKLDREIWQEDGEDRMGRLILAMLKLGSSESELQKVSTDKTYRNEMYKKYNIQ